MLRGTIWGGSTGGKAKGLAGRLGGCHGWWERGGSGENESKRVDVAAIREDCSAWQELGESEERRKKKRVSKLTDLSLFFQWIQTKMEMI
ncbi:hypothetical protein U1Q18_007288 [Sarracenia purpurea var. burkii]